MILVDIAQQSQSPYFLLYNEQRISNINVRNKVAIDRMHSGMQKIVGEYCKKDAEGKPVIEAGKFCFIHTDKEKEFYRVYSEFMQTKFDLIY